MPSDENSECRRYKECTLADRIRIRHSSCSLLSPQFRPSTDILPMPDFAYTARTPRARRSRASSRAANQREVLSQLLANVAVSAVGRYVGGRSGRAAQPSPREAPVDGDDLLAAGGAVARAACRCCGRSTCCGKQTSHGALKEVLSHVYSDVEEGATWPRPWRRIPRRSAKWP